MPKETPRSYIFFAVPFKVGTAELRDAVNIAIAQAGFTPMEAVQEFALRGDVVEEIRKAIQGASLVIGDATNLNPNVMWELGFAQASGKPILLLTQNPGTLPFNLSGFRAVTYQPGASFQGLTARLTDAISETIRKPTSKSVDATARSHVFFSYCHVDAEYLDRILIHLRPVERSGAIDLWSDTKIRAGDRWREEIRKILAKARISILLISADFLASEFIVTNELPPLLAAAEEQGVRVVPVILKPCRFLRDDSLARFQAFNDPTKPVIRMSEADREELYAKLAELVEAEIGLSHGR